MIDEKDKEFSVSLQRIAALKAVRDEAEAKMNDAKAAVKYRTKEFKKADAVFRQAVDDEREPTLFSEGIDISDADLDAARSEIAESKAEE